MGTGITMTICSFPDRERALECARTLIERKVAACAQVTAPITSVYTWKGKTCEDGEVLLFIKTTLDRTDEAIRLVKAAHPYDVPEIITVPIIDGFGGYFDWVRDTVEQ